MIIPLLTDSLIRALEQDLWRAKAPSSRPIRLDCRTLVFLQEPDATLTQLGALAGIVHCLLDGGCLGCLDFGSLKK